MVTPGSQNIRMTVAYDGTDFFGWQKTRMGRSVEEELQKVLEVILQDSVKLQAASRTDAGVHARGQVVNFIVPKGIKDLSRFQMSLNSLLPPAIVVIDIDVADNTFHPTLDCTGKEYHYEVCTNKIQLPQRRLYSWHYWYPLDLKKIEPAAAHLIGTHDFAAFCKVKQGTSYEDTVREIFSIDTEILPDQRIRIVIKGSNFLYRMVRNVVGTLLYVARGKISVDAIPEVLAKRHRAEAGITAPAHGLTLHRVFYIP